MILKKSDNLVSLPYPIVVSDKLSGPWLEGYINVYVCFCD